MENKIYVVAGVSLDELDEFQVISKSYMYESEINSFAHQLSIQNSECTLDFCGFDDDDTYYIVFKLK